MFEEAKSNLSQLKIAENPKKSKIEWISERTRSKCTNIWPFWKSCCGFPVWATFKVDIDSEHSVHKVFLIFYGSTTLLFSERTLNGWEQGPFMPKDHVNRGSMSFPFHSRTRHVRLKLTLSRTKILFSMCNAVLYSNVFRIITMRVLQWIFVRIGYLEVQWCIFD